MFRETCWRSFFSLELEVCWVTQAVRAGTEHGQTGRAAVLVSPLMPLTWQFLPSRPWTWGPDWIKSLPGWRIECCRQLDTSTSPTSPLRSPLFSAHNLWQPLCCLPPRLKTSSPPPLSSPLAIWPPTTSQPEERHCRDFPASSGSADRLTFCRRVVLSCSCSRLIPTDRPVSTSEASPPADGETRCLLKSTCSLLCFHF